MSAIRGIRGAIQVERNDADLIEATTVELLRTMVDRNRVDPEEMIAIWFTQTSDLTAAHAPAAARRLGWLHVPLMGGQEMVVDGQLPRVVRTLMLTTLATDRAPRHCYLGVAACLREDLALEGEER